MPKFTKAAMAAAALALLLSGCSAAASTSSEGKAPAAAEAPNGLTTAGKLTLCIDPEYAPLEYYANGSSGNIIGFDADAARALAKHWGLETKFEVTTFDGLMPGLQSRRCDAIFGGLYMSEARLAVADAAPVMKAGPSILAGPALAGQFKQPLDLCGRSVAAQTASSNAARINTLKDECKAAGKDEPKLTEYPKTAETVLAVMNGKSDALIETNVAASYMAAQNEGKLAVAPDVFETDTTFGVFTRKNDPISPVLAEALKALHKDGTLAQIAEDNKLDPAIVDVH
ncbi:polar amino acid transport system substrate-binding protein [Arthrobacter sp. V4I6]|uniref:ABC transporter substrate-binding protein n=1 Tax=unclassified Arthrobacter TaxID=235627 RepID=UPI002786CE9A|nr:MULTISPECIES: ABC transporter substrate-binding protein [unclassified Arthrobacter]MDQ0819529.1 polar amino acid transport system substrate-binding protein [Arthrobacter sp. V1I7]MDQ0853711.1 polar amino acid transport system substrate-binding protein [Arthrobacter sp. V4I6]